MKKAIIILTAMLVTLPAAAQAQKKSIVGFWKFTDGGFILEFSENTFGMFGCEQTEYKIDGNRIVKIIDGEEVSGPDKKEGEFKLKGKNKLVIRENGKELTGTRMTPKINVWLETGKYTTEGSRDYIEILGDFEAQIVSAGRTTPLNYITDGTTLYMTREGRYRMFKITDYTSFLGLPGEGDITGAVFEWTEPSEPIALSPESKTIAILNGSAVLEMTQSDDDFRCIGLRFTDKTMNWGCGTYIEVKKRNGTFLTRQDGEQYTSIDDAIEDFLKDLITNFYDDEEQGGKVWSAFVSEGGLQSFIETAHGWIDDDFLESPFNDIYG